MKNIPLRSIHPKGCAAIPVDLDGGGADEVEAAGRGEEGAGGGKFGVAPGEAGGALGADAVGMAPAGEGEGGVLRGGAGEDVDGDFGAGG